MQPATTVRWSRALEEGVASCWAMRIAGKEFHSPLLISHQSLNDFRVCGLFFNLYWLDAARSLKY